MKRIDWRTLTVGSFAGAFGGGLAYLGDVAGAGREA